jgi:iron(III) transport system substrate-binding protein
MLLALAAVGLAGCGGQAASSPATSSAAGTGSPSGSTAAAAKPPSAAASPAGASSAAKPSAWDDLVAAAKKEGTVTVYGTPGNAYRQFMVDEFEKAFPGIKVDAVFAPTAERQSRLQLERQAGKYVADIWASAGGQAFFDFKKAGVISPIPPQLVLPEVLDTSKWFENHLWWIDKSEPYVYAMPIGAVIPILYVNPKIVDPKQFTSYSDVLDPKWKGKVVATDIRNSGAGVAPSRMIRKALGDPFLGQMYTRTNAKVSGDQRQLVDWITTGSYPIGMFLDPGEATIAIKQGLPIAMVPPDQFKEGAPIGPNNGGIALIDRAPHPNAAKLYLNWYLSRDGQLAWQRQAGDNSYRIDIPKDMVNPLYVPKPGGNYVPVGNEEMTAAYDQPSLKKLIDEAIQAQTA